MATGRPDAAGEQQAQQVAGGLVGPVDVLDSTSSGALGGQAAQRGVHGVEQVAPVEPVAAVGARLVVVRRSVRVGPASGAPGIRRTRAGWSAISRSATAGSSRAIAPNSSLNGR